MRKKYIISIDPDQELNGVCFVELESKKVETAKMKFSDIVSYLKMISDDIYGRVETEVVIEAGWLNEKSNWHGGMSFGVASKIGKCVGANHQTGRLIAEMCDHLKIAHREVAPLRKCWKGKDGKISREELDALMIRNNIPPILTRTNQDQRDAILLALFHSNMIKK